MKNKALLIILFLVVVLLLANTYIMKGEINERQNEYAKQLKISDSLKSELEEILKEQQSAASYAEHMRMRAEHRADSLRKIYLKK